MGMTGMCSQKLQPSRIVHAHHPMKSGEWNPYPLDSDSGDASTRAPSCRLQNFRDDDEKVDLDGPVSNQLLQC